MSLTLGLFVVVYFTLFGVGLGYMMRLVRKGPVSNEGKEQNSGGPGQQRTPARPLSAAEDGSGGDDTHSLSKGN
jgi:cytochrome d ubiquinol oxidase subunit I